MPELLKTFLTITFTVMVLFLPLIYWLQTYQSIKLFTLWGRATSIVGLLFTSIIIYERIQVPQESRILQDGDSWGIQEVLLDESNLSLRKWKSDLYQEQLRDINDYRGSIGLEKIKAETVESFSPTKLSKLLNTPDHNLVFLDVRGEYERTKLRINDSQLLSFGDLIKDKPINLDNIKDKKIVIICYSGVRGYYAALLLKLQGYKNVSFVRGGIGRWKEKKLPGIFQDQEFLFAQDLYASVEATSEEHVINFSQNSAYGPTYFYEFLTSQEVADLITKAKQSQKEVVIVCQSESECFHISNLGYLLQENNINLKGFLRLSSE